MPTNVGAAELAERLAQTLGAPAGAEPLELRAVSLGRALRPDETLADAGLWDGAAFVLARARDPVEASSLVGSALAVASAPSHLAVLLGPDPPVLALPPVAAAPRSMLPFVALGIGLLALIGAGVWLGRGREAAPPTAEPITAALTVQPTAEPPATVSQSATVTVAAPTSAPLPRPGQVTSDEDTAWRELLAQLDVVWGADWPASISLLQTFHSQYPTRTSATEKLYAALVEYGRALHEAGATAAAADAFDQAVRLAPQRFEARDELAALAPTPTNVSERTSIPVPIVERQPTLAPPPTSVPVPTLSPVDTPSDQPACDITNADSACPLADGSRVQGAISVPDGRHFYWFGVPTSGMQLRVEVSGQACPCTVLVLSDAFDNASTPLAAVYASDASPTVLDQVVLDPGPYLLEVVPAQNSTNEPDALYQLVFGLRMPPMPTPTPLVEAVPTPVPVVAAAPTPTSRPVAVPPVAARSAGEAVDRVRGVGLVPRRATVDRYSPAGPGTVAAQDPPAGAAVPPGTSVTLLIASGNVVVPPVVGVLEEDASTQLHDAGLDIDTRRAPRSSVAAGRVADVNPGAGSVVPVGSKVVLTVSLGG